MARQAANEFDTELIVRAMNVLTDRAREGEHGLQFKPRTSIFRVLARALRITEPEARRLIAELQRRKLIELLNVGPGPRPEEQPAPDGQPEKEYVPAKVELSELAAIYLASQIQLQIDKLVAQRDDLLNGVLLMPRTIEMVEVAGS